MSNDTEYYFNVPQPRLIFFNPLYQPDYPTATRLTLISTDAFRTSDNTLFGLTVTEYKPAGLI
jgi:hypothetical protein